MTQGRFFSYPRRMQSGCNRLFQDLKRKTPQGHKALQGSVFLLLGRVDSNHQPPG